ncbi:MAG: HAMP domain-containing histidine kinase [Mogibacterium sp.]|nr:HAMP domain-containing histidine kinase [Mogibacterium sp.]
MNREKKQGFDLNSIKTTTLAYFMLFAVVLMIIIWILQGFITDKYYETLRVQEANRTTVAVKQQFRDAPPDDFDKYARQTAQTNGIYIRIDGGMDSMIYDGIANLSKDTRFESELTKAMTQLGKQNLESANYRISDKNTGNNYLISISKIVSPEGVVNLYIVTPLVPIQSTLSIIRVLMLYVFIIAIGFALLLSIYLTSKIVRPIESITGSALELARGNFNVKFDGGKMTETNELAEVLNTASYEMGKADFYQRELVANVSHDLKTPLTMIKSYAEMIQDISGDNPEKRNEHLGVIIAETDRLNKLVSNLMSVSLLQSNTITLDRKTFDFVEMCQEVYESVAVLNEQEGYNIVFTPCKPTLVYGDRERLSQVLHNFVSNAIKYGGEDKYVGIELKRSGKKVSVHVKDNGMGIPKDDLPHIWDRYYRSSANHNREIDGSGIGLSISKTILSLHNTNFGVNSDEFIGSDFWFEMPVAKKA